MRISLFNVQLVSQLLEVLYKLPRVILFQAAPRSRLSAPPLVEEDNSVVLRIEESTAKRGTCFQ